MNETLLSLKSISVSMAGRDVLKDVSINVDAGEFFSLLGPSGCGKTTLLRIIAGFLEPSLGQISWAGENITHHPPQRRDLNLVFQNYALFSHLNVFENVAFGLHMQKLEKQTIIERVMHALALVRMSEHSHRRVTELSGGQQQRIALARAIAPRPKLVLLDEPLGALDLQLRKEMQWELKSLQRQLNMTFLYVTHDQEEAFAMSDRIAILNRGQIEQISTPEELYLNPASRFVADFIGTANFLPAEKVSHQCARFLSSEQLCDLNHHLSAQTQDSYPIKGEVLLRPEQLMMTHTPMSGQPTFNGVIQMKQYLGAISRYHVEVQGLNRQPVTITVDTPSSSINQFTPGAQVAVQITASSLHFFPTSLQK